MEEKVSMKEEAGQSEERKEGTAFYRRTVVDGSDGTEHSVLPHLLVDLPVDARWDLGSDGQLERRRGSGTRTGGIGCEPRERGEGARQCQVRQHCVDSEGRGRIRTS